MHNYSVNDIKNLILQNNFEVGDYVLFNAVYGHALLTYQILRINGDDYTIRYISHVGQFNPEGISNKVIKVKHMFMKNHMTKIKNYEKIKN